jgi:hypothetical protein
MIWSLALAAVGVLGIYLSGKKNYWGWGIGLGAQVLWIVYAIVTQQWGFIISALAYGWVYGKNFLSWRGESILARTPVPEAIVRGTDWTHMALRGYVPPPTTKRLIHNGKARR